MVVLVWSIMENDKVLKMGAGSTEFEIKDLGTIKIRAERGIILTPGEASIEVFSSEGFPANLISSRSRNTLKTNIGELVVKTSSRSSSLGENEWKHMLNLFKDKLRVTALFGIVGTPYKVFIERNASIIGPAIGGRIEAECVDGKLTGNALLRTQEEIEDGYTYPEHQIFDHWDVFSRAVSV